jgi:hypothetical protein
MLSFAKIIQRRWRKNEYGVFVEKYWRKNWEKNLFQCHFAKHVSHMDWPGTEIEPSR